jgi:hypothetical protein
MSVKKRPPGIFIFGLLTGLIGGLVLAVYVISSGVFRLMPETKINKASTLQNSETSARADLSKPATFKTYTASQYKIKPANINDSVYEIDSSDIELMGYTQLFDSDIPVRRDEMLLSIDIIVDGIEDDESKNLDSLLIDDKYYEVQRNLYRVEFWKSPINFTGYKLQGQKLVLFGVFDYQSVKLLYHKPDLYLHYLDRYYHLETLNEFSRLKTVNKPQ